MIVTLGQYNIGEKPTVILYTYYNIDRHAGTPDNNSHIQRIVLATEERTVTQQVSHETYVPTQTFC